MAPTADRTRERRLRKMYRLASDMGLALETCRPERGSQTYRVVSRTDRGLVAGPASRNRHGMDLDGIETFLSCRHLPVPDSEEPLSLAVVKRLTRSSRAAEPTAGDQKR